MLRTRARLARLALPALIVSATTIAACSGLSQSDQTLNHYGAINVSARGTAANRATANATVVFFDAFTVNVPDSYLQRTDQCTFANVDTTKTVTTGSLKAGASVAFAFGSSTLTFPYDSTLLRYANPASTPFVYSNGDVARVTVAGATGGFPASTISVPLAEPVIPGDVQVPPFGSPLNVTWTASADTTSAIILALKYANPVTSPYANEQIYCTLKDDGAFTLPATALTYFGAAPGATRTLQLTRWRTRAVLIDSKTLLHIASSVDTIVKFP